jgi:large-conductance mechanosensitive channel
MAFNILQKLPLYLFIFSMIVIALASVSALYFSYRNLKKDPYEKDVDDKTASKYLLGSIATLIVGFVLVCISAFLYVKQINSVNSIEEIRSLRPMQS